MASRSRSSAPAREGDDERADGSLSNGLPSNGARAERPRANGARTNGAGGIPPARIMPIYKRLPHGPHRLGRSEVVLHQRARIHGAMVEAVAEGGYQDTSVKRVIGLAGVSRRSFYEQFNNKEDCFFATFDLIVRREIKQIRKAYLATDGPLEERATAALRTLARIAVEERNANVLVVLEAQRAGVDGVLRLRNAIGACEQMLAQSFTEERGAVALPLPIIRAIAGGLHSTLATFLCEHTADSVDLAQEMLDWTMLFQAPGAERISERMAAGLATRLREISSAYGHGLSGAEAPARDERTRLLQGILRLAAREDFRKLSAPQIADEANVSIDVFCEMFDGKNSCFLAAVDMIGDELLAIAADPELASSDWPAAVRRVLAQLMRYLADHPLHARTLAQEAFFAGTDAAERNVELSRSIARRLTEGAPVEADRSLINDAVAGAIWHTIRCQVVSGRIPLLAALSDHLAYVVLAPFIGAEAALATVASGACDPRALQNT
jgi:TetR/AcrR family transcriptional regulator